MKRIGATLSSDKFTWLKNACIVHTPIRAGATLSVSFMLYASEAVYTTLICIFNVRSALGFEIIKLSSLHWP